MNSRVRTISILAALMVASWAIHAAAQEGDAHPDDAMTLVRLPARAAALRAAASSASERAFDATFLGPGEASRAIATRDPEGVMAFMRSHFAYEPYRGNVRGARGALFSRSGNSLDLALLTGSLLDAIGLDWRLVRGELSEEQATTLLAATLPNAELTGADAYMAFGAGLVDTPLRQRNARDHWWVEFDAREEWRAIDPVFPGLAVGETATGTIGTFTADALPDDVASRVTVTLMFRRARRSSERSLTFTAPMADLSYRNFALRFTPSGARDVQPSLETLGETTQGVAFPRDDTEAIWLEVELTIGESSRHLQRNLRASDDAVDLFEDGLQVFSLLFLPGWVGPDYYTAVSGSLLQDAASQAETLASRISDEGAGLDPVGRFAAPLSELLGDGAGLLALRAANLSDADSLALASSMGTRPYFAWPRVLISGAAVTAEGLSVQLDVRSNVVEAAPYHGLPAQVAQAFQAARGRRTSAILAHLVETVTSLPTLSASQVLAASWQAGRQFLSVSAAEARELRRSELPAVVRERVEGDIQSDGAVVVVPSAPVNHTSGPRFGWWLLQSDTGNLVGVLDSGVRDVMASPRLGSGDDAPGGRLGGISQVVGFLEGLAEDANRGLPGGSPLNCRESCDLLRISSRACSGARLPDLDQCLGEDDGATDPLGLGLACGEVAEAFRCGAAVAVAIANGQLAVSNPTESPFWGPFLPLSLSAPSTECTCDN